MNKKKTGTKDRGFFAGRNIFFVQLVVALITVFFIYRLGVIPTKYLLAALGALALVNALVGLMLFKTKGKLLNFSKILSLLLSLAMALGVKYVAQGNSFIENLFGNKDTHLISVVVPVDSEYNSISDVKTLTFGANTTMDKTNIDTAITLFEKEHKFTPTISDYTTYESLANDLLDGTVPVMLLSESQRGIVEASHENFSNDTKVIGSVSYQTDVNIAKPDVNTKSDTYSIYLSGIDTYGPVSAVSRSDVNMIITVNPVENQILLTSIPRDYYVPLGTIGEYDKLTHAGNFGVGESIATLEKLFDINIDYYVRVNFSSVEGIVDALGGVDVYSRYTFTSMHGNYNFQKGMNHMSGAESLGFVRERYTLPNGDSDRVVNQQELLKGILNKAMSPSILLNFNSVLNSVGSSVEMSIPQNDLKTIVRHQLDTGASWDFQAYTLTGYGTKSTTTYLMPGWNLYVMDPNYDSVNHASGLIHEMEAGNRIQAAQ